MRFAPYPINRRELSMLRRFGQRARRQLQRRYGSQWIVDFSVCRGYQASPDPAASAWLTGPDRCGWVTAYADAGAWVFGEKMLRRKGAPDGKESDE